MLTTQKFLFTLTSTVLVRPIACFSSTNNGGQKHNIPRPQNPTMAESFGTKIPKEDLENLLNPIGFLDPEDHEQYEGLSEDGKVQNSSKVKSDDTTKSKAQDEATKAALSKAGTMAKEYGFKVKGLEPTRYGDWERKGRCYDF